MASPNFMMITVATCTPSYLGDAMKHLSRLCDELKSDAGARTTRYGIVATGDHTGQIMLVQTYDALSGVEAAFDLYQKSDTYSSIISSGHIAVTLRNILRIEDLGLANPSSDVPAYAVFTRWGHRDLKLDAMRAEVPHFENNGAMIMRYCTIMTGQTAGRRLLVVGYPSMDAIEKTYETLRGSEGYNKLVSEFDIDWRNIVRVMG